MIRRWLGGLVRRRAGRLGAAAAGVAVAVALLASLGAFLAASQASMTARAVRDVAVDWQVAVQPGADPTTVLDMTRGATGVRTALPVGFAHTAGMSTNAGGTTQTTGPGVVLGLPPGYRSEFPGEIRTLTGGDQGVLLGQQTAANLHAAPSDVVWLELAGRAPVSVRVDGVVDLPQANSLFQHRVALRGRAFRAENGGPPAVPRVDGHDLLVGWRVLVLLVSYLGLTVGGLRAGLGWLPADAGRL